MASLNFIMKIITIREIDFALPVSVLLSHCQYFLPENEQTLIFRFITRQGKTDKFFGVHYNDVFC